jgi:hypothetical protein
VTAPTILGPEQRVDVASIRIGDTVTVFAHPATRIDGALRTGTVTAILRGDRNPYGFPVVRLSLADGDAPGVAYDAVEDAVAYMVERHTARPCDCPESECPSCCKDCGDPITWMGPSHLDWEHTDEA